MRLPNFDALRRPRLFETKLAHQRSVAMLDTGRRIADKRFILESAVPLISPYPM